MKGYWEEDWCDLPSIWKVSLGLPCWSENTAGIQVEAGWLHQSEAGGDEGLDETWWGWQGWKVVKLNRFGRLGQFDLMDWIQPAQLSNVKLSSSGFQENIFQCPLLCFWLCCLFHSIFSCFCLVITAFSSAVSSGFSSSCVLPLIPCHDFKAILDTRLQLCPTLCDPLDCSPSDSSVHEILQARTLEWVAMPSSRGFSQFRDWTLIFCVSCNALEIECIQIPISSANLSWALMLCFQLFISRLLLKPQSSSQSSRFETLCPYCTAAAAAKSLQSCPTLCNPIDSSPPGSPIPGILQARTLEWLAISFSNAWKWTVKVKSLSRVRLLATQWTAAHQAPPSMGFSRQEYWSGVPLPSPLIVLVPMKQC